MIKLKNKKVGFIGILLILVVIGLLFCVGLNRVGLDAAREVYQVYLDGEKIGLIEDETALFDLIDREQELIKKQFGVDRVYPPAGLMTTKYVTYSNKLSSASEIYNLIESKSTFTILGYTVTIKPDDGDSISLNILNKEDLEPALMDAASAFINTDELNNYLNDTQTEVTDIGRVIENVYFEEKITIKENYLPVNTDIITNKNDLTKYLLFGTLEKQDEYTVKSGDTVETVAFNNKLSNEELLIANPNLSSVNSLLSAGQKLNIGLINPLFTIVEESQVVEDVEAAYSTIYEDDSSRYVGDEYVKQKGVNGVNRITENVQYKNGDITTLIISNSTEVSAPVDKIVVRGTKSQPDYNFHYYPPAASGTDWGWPTTSPYVITSYYGWRWGRLHGGIDISGTGWGSPIYSATDGVVVSTYAGCANAGYYGSSCGGGLGNSVTVQSSTGLTIIYAHIKNNLQVSEGQSVSKGQLLGYMGSSGSSTGTHLHFEIRDANGNKINPCAGAFLC